MGIVSVAVYSEPDRDAQHLRDADEAFRSARGADRELPGHREDDRRREGAGAEGSIPATASSPRTPSWRARCEEAGLVWIGPPPDAIERWARRPGRGRRCRRPGVPIVPGSTEVAPARGGAHAAEETGYPLPARRRAAVAARASRLRWRPRTARGLRGRPREGREVLRRRPVYIEHYLEDPRHVEVQVLADAHGNVVHLGERDCTIQRRHQKVIEETPSPARRRGDARADRQDRHRRGGRGRLPLGRHDRGHAAPDDAYFFLEMNTRVQVEHS